MIVEMAYKAACKEVPAVEYPIDIDVDIGCSAANSPPSPQPFTSEAPLEVPPFSIPKRDKFAAASLEHDLSVRMSSSPYEMNPYQRDDRPLLAAPSYTPLPLSEFLSEVSTLRTSIARFRENVTTISELHSRSLAAYDSGAVSSENRQLEAVIAETTALSKDVKDHVKSLERDLILTERAGNMGDAATKRGQVNRLKDEVREVAEEYQRVELQFQKKYREQMARQYRIVNPEATEEEIEHVVTSGETQIFSQALMSTRVSSATSVNAAVRARNAEIQRIETTLVELLELFQQLNTMVEVQEEMVTNIAESSEQVVQDLESANEKLGAATESARGARKKKWMCLGLSILILIVIVAIILAVVLTRQATSKAVSG
ncbi:hypothetical protein RUND412_010798 [Rhizina undulata]